MIGKRTTGRRDLDDDQKGRLALAIDALRDKLVSEGKDSTQEAIATMLGSERSTIAKALRAKAGSIGLAVATAHALGRHVSTIAGERRAPRGSGIDKPEDRAEFARERPR